jgi:hypothetical protein
MGTIDSLRSRAEECREHALRARTAEVRAQWLAMADIWLKLACDPLDVDTGAALAS